MCRLLPLPLAMGRTEWRDSMAKNSGHPDFPKGGKQVYKYDASIDAAEKAKQTYPVFDMNGNPVVMKPAFERRRDAQIKNRKKQGM